MIKMNDNNGDALNLNGDNLKDMRTAVLKEAMVYSHTQAYHNKIKFAYKVDDNYVLECNLREIEKEENYGALHHSCSYNLSAFNKSSKKYVEAQRNGVVGGNSANHHHYTALHPSSGGTFFNEWLYIQRSRGYFDSGCMFFLALLGGIIGIGNVASFWAELQLWGSSMFVIPYMVHWLFSGIPILQLEILLGNMLRGGPVKIFSSLQWWMVGVGVAVSVNAFLVNLMLARFITNLLMYIYAAFECPLPWSINDSDIQKCHRFDNDAENCEKEGFNYLCSYTIPDKKCNPSPTGKASIYYLHSLESSSVNLSVNPNAFNLQSCILCFFVWLFIAGYTYRGVFAFSFISAIVLFVAFLLLTCLAVRTLHREGITHMLTLLRSTFSVPDVSYAWLNNHGWLDSFLTVMFDLNLGLGTHSTIASYTKIGYNVVYNGIMAAGLDISLCLVSYITLMAIVGSMSTTTGISVKQIIQKSKAGQSILTLYPAAFNNLSNPSMFAIFTFGAVALICAQVSAITMQSVITTLQESITFRNVKLHWLCVFLALIGYILSLPFCLNSFRSGLHIFYWICNSLITPTVIFFQIFLVGWVYGFSDQVEKLGLKSVLIFDIGFFVAAFFRGIYNTSITAKKGDCVFVGDLVSFFLILLSLILSLLVKSPERLKFKDRLWWILLGNINKFRAEVHRIMARNEFWICRLTVTWAVCIKFLNTFELISALCLKWYEFPFQMQISTKIDQHNMHGIAAVAGTCYIILAYSLIVFLPFLPQVTKWLKPPQSDYMRIEDLPSKNVAKPMVDFSLTKSFLLLFAEFYASSSNVHMPEVVLKILNKGKHKRINRFLFRNTNYNVCYNCLNIVFSPLSKKQAAEKKSNNNDVTNFTEMNLVSSNFTNLSSNINDSKASYYFCDKCLKFDKFAKLAKSNNSNANEINLGTFHRRSQQRANDFKPSRSHKFLQNGDNADIGFSCSNNYSSSHNVNSFNRKLNIMSSSCLVSLSDSTSSVVVDRCADSRNIMIYKKKNAAKFPQSAGVKRNSNNSNISYVLGGRISNISSCLPKSVENVAQLEVNCSNNAIVNDNEGDNVNRHEVSHTDDKTCHGVVASCSDGNSHGKGERGEQEILSSMTSGAKVQKSGALHEELCTMGDFTAKNMDDCFSTNSNKNFCKQFNGDVIIDLKNSLSLNHDGLLEEAVGDFAKSNSEHLSNKESKQQNDEHFVRSFDSLNNYPFSKS